MAVHGTSRHAVTYSVFSYVFIIQYKLISVLTVPIKSIHPMDVFPLLF